MMAEDWGYESEMGVMERLIRFEDRFIVDVGCGAGQLSRELGRRGSRVLGIEPHPEQAADNARAPVQNNVGFAQAGAAQIPVEPESVDGLVFSNSLHHVPAAHHAMVVEEMTRVLKPDGFVYVLEPIANGTKQYVMSLFHDETAVRLAAYRTLVNDVQPKFGQMREVYFDVDYTYDSFDEFADHYCNVRYNSYPSAAVRSAAVQKRFEACRNSHGSYTMTQPMRVNLYMKPAHRSGYA